MTTIAYKNGIATIMYDLYSGGSIRSFKLLPEENEKGSFLRCLFK